MSKTAVHIDLVWTDDETQKMGIQAIVSARKIVSDKMYFHVYEDQRLYAGILHRESDDPLRFVAEWGGEDDSHVVLELVDRPLEIDQEVQRTDTSENTSDHYTYRIVGLTDLLA